MADELINSLNIAASGMNAQSQRLKVIAQNIANADNVGQFPGDMPYRRKIISFDSYMDKEMGTEKVKVAGVRYDPSPMTPKYDPNHPAADPQGYIYLPNVNPVIEMTDMRETQRSYEANVNVVEVTKSMLQDTINLLR
jgi:flagellar basal-body rod protein FlgC